MILIVQSHHIQTSFKTFAAAFYYFAEFGFIYLSSFLSCPQDLVFENLFNLL